MPLTLQQDLLTALELLGFGAAALLVLVVVGAGVTKVLLPDDPRALLIAPAAGLGTLVVGFQVLTYVVPPPWGAAVVIAVTGALTARVGWRARSTLFAAGWELAWAGGLTLLFFLTLVQIDVQRGFLTLGGIASDNLFAYVPAGEYLRSHPTPYLFQSLATLNPGTFTLTVTGPQIPNSKGVFDAAAGVLGGLPTYAVFDPVNAIAVAVTVGPTWYFVRSVLGGSSLVAAVASVLLATNQLLYWVVGNGFQQECLALPVFTAGLAVATLAFRTGRRGAALLAGLLGASLVGLYFPISVIFGAMAVACLVVHFAVQPRAQWRTLARTAGWAVAAARVGSLAADYMLFVRGGLRIWQATLGTQVPAGAVYSFPALPYLIGSLPFAHIWPASALGFNPLQVLIVPAVTVVSLAMVALIVVGEWRALLAQRAPEAAILTAGLAIVVYEVAVAQFPYGFVKAITYVVPFTSAFIAVGIFGLGSRAGAASAGRRRLWVRTAAWAAMVVIVVSSANASRDMLHVFLAQDPTLTTARLGFAHVATAIPPGSSVFIDHPAQTYDDLVDVAAVANFLPDRTVRIFVGDLRLGSFSQQNERPDPCDYDFVIATDQPAGDFDLVDLDLAPNMHVYKRGPGIC